MTGPAPITAVDDEALVCGWLGAQPGITAIGATVADRLPDGYDGTQPAVVVTRIGGAMDPAGGGQWLDRPRWDVDCHGPNKAAAKDLVSAVRALLAVARWHDHSAAGAAWCDTTEDVGPQWIADTDYPEAGRYLLQVSALIHPLVS
jgi:hypothetical protein